jgi:hypothetical protein
MSSLSKPDGEQYGQFPSVLSVKTPLGMREQLCAAAAVEKISVGEYVRRALGEALGVAILPKSDNAESHSGASGALKGTLRSRRGWSRNSPGLRRRSTKHGRIASWAVDGIKVLKMVKGYCGASATPLR